MEVDDTSMNYFMSSMHQKEFETMIGKKVSPYIFNLITYPTEVYEDISQHQIQMPKDVNKKEILNKLKDLRRDDTEERPKASVSEAIDCLITVCEHLVNSCQTKEKEIE